MTDRPKTLNRRQFISKTLAGAGAAAAVGGLVRPQEGLARPAAASVPASPAAVKPLVTRTLGKTGYTLPVVNMGVMNADNPDLVRRAFELGMRHFDTAAGYWRGKNEEMIGKVIGGLKARDQVVIATKINIPPERRQSFSA